MLPSSRPKGSSSLVILLLTAADAAPPAPLCRAQRAQASKVQKAVQPEVTVLYASQTGTAQEVARSVQAASAEHNVKSRVRCPTLHYSIDTAAGYLSSRL